MLSLLLILLGEPGMPAPPKPPRPPQTVPEAPGDALLREAKSLRYGQRWFEAAAAYRRFLGEYPTSSRIAETRFWLAATLEQDQRWEEAIAAYTEFLRQHPDQRMLGREAQLNRIRCWGIRQKHNPEASQGLIASLGAEEPEIQTAAALQLAKVGDRRGMDALQRGLSLPTYADACSLALVNLGVKPQALGAPKNAARFLVIRVQEKGKSDTVTLRLALTLARAVENYLSEAQIKQAKAKGIDIDHLSERASALPKGSLLLSVEDGKSSINITVE